MDNTCDKDTTLKPRSAKDENRTWERIVISLADDIVEVVVENNTSEPTMVKDVNCSMIDEFENK